MPTDEDFASNMRIAAMEAKIDWLTKQYDLEKAEERDHRRELWSFMYRGAMIAGAIIATGAGLVNVFIISPMQTSVTNVGASTQASIKIAVDSVNKSIDALKENTASREGTADAIAQLRRDVDRLDATAVTKDWFNVWVGHANQGRR